MDDRLSLEVEYPMDIPSLKRDSAEAKKEISGVNQTAEVTAAKASAKINKLMADQNAGTKLLDKNIQTLKIQMASYQAIVEKSLDPKVIELYNQKIEETAQKINSLNGMGRSTARRDTGMNGLHFSMQQIMREMPAFAYSTQTGFMAISNNIPMVVDEIGRLQQANVALTASGQKAVPIWRQLVKGLFSWQSAMAIGITVLTVWGKDIMEWVISLTKGKKAVDDLALSQEQLNKGFESNTYKTAVEQISGLRTNVDLAKEGLISKTEVVKQYNEGIGKTIGQVETLDQVERSLADNANSYVEMMLYKAAATAALEEASKKAVEAAKAMAQTDEEAVPYILSGTQGARNARTGKTAYETAAENSRKREAKAADDQKDRLLKIANDFQKRAAEIFKNAGFASFFGNAGATDKEGQRIMNQRQQLLDRIATLDAEYARKSFAKDAEELQALRDKFAKIRTEVERFNADPKNKNVRIDIAGLADVEDRAVADLTYRQGTRKLAAELDLQAALWREYEEYKTATSAEYADERYADELGKIRSFRGELEKQVSDLTMKSITDGLTGGEAERLKALDTLLRAVENKEQADRDRRFQAAYKATLTYEKQRQKIIADSEAKIAVLKDSAAKDEARKQRDRALLELDVEYLKSMDTIKSVFDDVDEMSSAAGRKALAAARDTFEAFINEGGKTGRHIEALRKIFNKLFDDVDKGLADRGVEGWRTISAELSTIAGTIGQIDKGTGQWLDTLANVIGNVAKVKAGLKEMKDAQQSGDTMQGVTSFMGVYGAILGAVGGIFSRIVDGMVARREAEWAYRQEQQQKQAQALNKVLEYQLSLINDLYGVNRLERYREVIDEINKAQSDLAEAIQGRILNVGDQYVDKLIADINSGKTSIAELERSVQSLRHQADAMNPQSASDFGNQNALYANARKIEQALERIRAGVVLTGSESIEDLKKLYGQLDDGTIEQIERLDELKQKYKEVFNQLREEITGTSFSALLDSSLSIFRDGGADAGDAWAEGFDKMVEDYMIQKFSRDYLAEKMQAWYDTFAEFAEDGLTESEKDMLRAERDRIWREGNQVLDDLRDTLGVEKPLGSGSSTGISGRINRTIEESTASAILGFERSKYDLQKQELGNAEETLRVEKKMYDALLQSIRHQAAIEQNTADTVTELRTAVVELKAINKNTKPASMRNLGV